MAGKNLTRASILRYSITCLGSGLFLVGLCPPPVLPPPLGPRFLNIQIRLHSSSLQNLSVPPHSPREKSPTSLEEDAFISHTLSFPFLPTLLPSLSLSLSVFLAFTPSFWLISSGFLTSNSDNNEKVTGRKARGLQMEEIACKCQTFLSLLSGRRKQTSNIFFLLYTNLKKGFS